MHHTKIYQDFIKAMEFCAYRYSYGQVFSDFLTMAICGFHAQNIRTRLKEPNPENEALYLETVKRYPRKDLDNVVKLLPLVMKAAQEQEYSDILGCYFTEYITKGHNGQFFTPDAVCELMAQMTGQDEGRRGQRILDPACGSGRMLLAKAKYHPDNYFFGADNDQTCAKMATLNFFLNGLRGEVAWMNSLSMEFYGAWRINSTGLGIVPIPKEESVIWAKAPEPIPAPEPETRIKVKLEPKPKMHPVLPGQLSLF